MIVTKLAYLRLHTYKHVGHLGTQAESHEKKEKKKKKKFQEEILGNSIAIILQLDYYSFQSTIKLVETPTCISCLLTYMYSAPP